MSKQSKHKNSRSLLSQTLRIFTVVIVIVLVTVAIIAGIGWWAGWRTEGKFKTAIQVAGLVLIGVGFLGIKGNRDMTRSFEYQYGMSVTKDDSWKRTQQSLKDFAQSYSFLLIMFFAGGLCMVIGWLM
jgi:hypothetical protein